VSPIRNVSVHLAEVMQRSESRGARLERERLARRAQAIHEAAHAANGVQEYRRCPEPVCRALAQLLMDEAPGASAPGETEP
jgi:hypothetical protein